MCLSSLRSTSLRVCVVLRQRFFYFFTTTTEIDKLSTSGLGGGLHENFVNSGGTDTNSLDTSGTKCYNRHGSFKVLHSENHLTSVYMLDRRPLDPLPLNWKVGDYLSFRITFRRPSHDSLVRQYSRHQWGTRWIVRIHEKKGLTTLGCRTLCVCVCLDKKVYLLSDCKRIFLSEF